MKTGYRFVVQKIQDLFQALLGTMKTATEARGEKVEARVSSPFRYYENSQYAYGDISE